MKKQFKTRGFDSGNPVSWKTHLIAPVTHKTSTASEGKFGKKSWADLNFSQAWMDCTAHLNFWYLHVPIYMDDMNDDGVVHRVRCRYEVGDSIGKIAGVNHKVSRVFVSRKTGDQWEWIVELELETPTSG